jgi:hypothetical protein
VSVMNSVLLFLILLAIVCPACLMGVGEGLIALVLLLLFVVPAILVLYVFPGFLFIVIPVAALWIWIARSEPKPEGADDRAAALHQHSGALVTFDLRAGMFLAALLGASDSLLN